MSWMGPLDPRRPQVRGVRGRAGVKADRFDGAISGDAVWLPGFASFSETVEIRGKVRSKEVVAYRIFSTDADVWC